MKTIITVVLALSLTGCGWFDRYVTANVTGNAQSCIDGVMYIQFPSGATVKYKPDGKVWTC